MHLSRQLRDSCVVFMLICRAVKLWSKCEYMYISEYVLNVAASNVG